MVDFSRWGTEPTTGKQVNVDRLIVAILAVAAALLATADDAAPTGLGAIDALWRALAAVVVVLCAAYAPPVFLLVSAVAAAASSAAVLNIVLGAIAIVVAVLVVWRKPGWHGPAAFAGVLISVIVFRLPHDEFLGMATLVALAVVAPIVAAALYEGPLWLARLLGWGAGLVAAGTVAAAALFGLVMFDARGDLDEIADLADDAEQHFRDGNEDEARASLAEAVEKLEDVEAATTSGWMRLTRIVPVLGQHTNAIQVVTEHGAATAVAAQDVLLDLDRDALTISTGSVDLVAVERMQPSVAALAVASVEASDAVASVPDAWLIPPVANGLDRVLDDIEQLTTAARRADDAVRLAPSMLGGDGTRNHLVLFATPAELRGSMGLIGNWALIEADDGNLRLDSVGRVSDLVPELEALDVDLTEPADYLERYGTSAVEVAFHDITLSPHFPDVAQVGAQLFEAATGTPIDTVMMVDPAGVASLITLTGPVQVGEHTLSADNARDFLLVSQYVVFDTNAERIDFLEALLTQTFTRLLAIDFPDPWDLDEVFADVVGQDRLVLASTDPQEQALLDDLGVAGAFPADYDEGDDLVAIVAQNQGQNKIDSWLTRHLRYDAKINPATGAVDATITVELTNDVPPFGLPDTVIGSNDQGLPPGTNRLALSVYSPHSLLASRVDGVEAGFQAVSQFGLRSYTRVVDIPAGETVTIELEVTGELEIDDVYRLVVPVQPTVIDDQLSVRVSAPAGVSLDDNGPRWQTTRTTSSDTTFDIPID